MGSLPQNARLGVTRTPYTLLQAKPPQTYYSRLGYKPAIEFNIISPFDVPPEYFMAINLQGKNSLLNAKVKYPKEFLI